MSPSDTLRCFEGQRAQWNVWRKGVFPEGQAVMLCVSAFLQCGTTSATSRGHYVFFYHVNHVYSPSHGLCTVPRWWETRRYLMSYMSHMPREFAIDVEVTWIGWGLLMYCHRFTECRMQLECRSWRGNMLELQLFCIYPWDLNLILSTQIPSSWNQALKGTPSSTKLRVEQDFGYCFVDSIFWVPRCRCIKSTRRRVCIGAIATLQFQSWANWQLL